ncbi:hypothetical protein OROMI_021161 [Orobanche minor]
MNGYLILFIVGLLFVAWDKVYPILVISFSIAPWWCDTVHKWWCGTVDKCWCDTSMNGGRRLVIDRPVNFTLIDIIGITNGFNTFLGHGAFADVHRGKLNGASVAVKSLRTRRDVNPQWARQLLEYEFQAELNGGWSLDNQHIVKLIGYCIHADTDRHLVYEYCENGDLKKRLHSTQAINYPPLSWQRRIRITIQVASALLHMHREADPKRIHNDIKPENILLDHNFNAKVSDFGLVTIMKEDGSYQSVFRGGTPGYMSARQQQGWVGPSCDKFAFGCLLMELVTGLEVVDRRRPHHHLKDWFNAVARQRRYQHLIDPRICAKPSLKALERVTTIALLCTHDDRHRLPTLVRVIRKLQKVENDIDYGPVPRPPPPRPPPPRPPRH